MADLQELFSRLKAEKAAQSTDSSQAQAQNRLSHLPAGHQAPNVSSPLFSPPLHTLNPSHPSSNVISPVNPLSAPGSPNPDSNRANLLNLLKFTGQAGQQSSPLANLQNVGAARVPSTHLPNVSNRDTTQPDLVANLRSLSSSGAVAPSPLAEGSAEKLETRPNHSGNQQDLLLGLLTKARSPQSAVGSIGRAEPSAQSSILRASTPGRPVDAPVSSQFEAPQPTKPPRFNYVNPFDQLHSSSPLNNGRAPKQEPETEPRKFEILKHEREASSNGESTAPAAKSRRVDVTEKAPPISDVNDTKVESVSEALEGVAEKVDKQVEQALARAKKAFSNTGSPTPGKDVIKKEPKQEPDSNWESAEDEAALIEQKLKVEVYNFPMKPFVSLRIKQTKSARSISQEHFLVVAQLKKEFDQIDRSLVTASQSHIVYAQAATKKDNGGFRIIRQDTGDHKQIFRSSGERIFNVQLCSSNLASHDIETVLGTGVNGSVFWTSLAK